MNSVTRREEIHTWELEKMHIWELHKKPNKKRKRSLLRKHTEEKEGNANNSNESNKLSADVISCIFIRCTVNTLSMLKCASKSWNDFITSPFFVHSHLEHSTENAQVLFVKRSFPNLQRLRRRRLQFVSVDMEGKGESNELYAVTLPELHISCSGMIVCSGLVCLFSGNDRIYLCNPVMRQLCKLPKCSPTDLPIRGNFGFGYLHSTKEYKVVQFFYTCPAGNNPIFTNPKLFQLRCELFTFTSLINGPVCNSWKEIAETPPCHPLSPGVLVKECLYWLAKPNVLGNADRILSFDFENEKFLTISYPSSLGILAPLSVMDLKGVLCLPDLGYFHQSSILDLWILKDKISCIWVKGYSINLVNYVPRRIFPIFRTWNEGIIFMYSGMVVFYDLKRKCVRTSRIGFGITQDPGIMVFGFGIYRKSLFSLGST